MDERRVERAGVIANEAGFEGNDAGEAVLALTELDGWGIPTPPVISVAALTRRPSMPVRVVRPLLIGSLAAVLVLASAFAASPQVRSVVAGWFGTTTVRLPYMLGDAYFLSPKVGWVAVGNVHSHTWRLYQTKTGGASWHLALTFPAQVSRQQGQQEQYSLSCCTIQFVTARTWFLLSWSGRRSRAVFERTTNAGRTWQHLTPPPTGGLGGPFYVRFVNAHDGWTSSSEYMGMGHSYYAFYGTRDGGQSWRLLASSLPGRRQTGAWTPGISGFASGQNGWTFSTGFGSGVLGAARTSDGGVRWHACGPPNYRPTPISAACGPAIPIPDLGVQEGAMEMEAMDGGDYFGRQGVLLVNTGIYTSHGLRNSMYLYRLRRNGASWAGPDRLPLRMRNLDSKSLPPSKEYHQPVFDIASPNAWYFVDPWQFSFTTDGGRHWTYRPSGLKTWTATFGNGYRYLAGYEPVGIQFFGAKTGYLWATQSFGKGGPRSVLRWTSNGGKTWRDISLPAG